ncbi:hypothetical protein THAOC_09019 [Thalassiosira oceanica]|uniref:Uncharacterized protein n=1 Tax=Thalassiosira oceanica TaxID=159749 RepID=K0TH04_THAOC|nr:hypothetical protein THAOC_09019 [Thalassiosira oceanica]|eukprot:EJK69697.1 hypothetical protein THAOC_09019 [Thalassiosira oceanica]
MEGAPAQGKGAQLGGPGPTQLAPVSVGRASIVAKSAPEGVPSIHEEGEARQLKTNPFPTQSYPTRKRQQARGPPVDVGDLSREKDRQRKIRFVVEPLLLARSLNWSLRAVCSCLVARAHHSQQTSATYARSSAGPRIHYLDAPQTQPSSARLQRQQAGRGRLKPDVRQNRVTTDLGARRFLGLPSHPLLARPHLTSCDDGAQ